MERTTADISEASGSTIRSVSTEILDVPTIREHKLSSLAVTRQSCVIVRLMTEDGVEGLGEAATLGGPRWAEESVETIKAVIDTYLAPAISGMRIDRPRAARQRLDAAAKRNNAAKAAIETALLDALGKTLGLPVHALLGGAVREHVPVLWALASGDPEQEIDEALAVIEARRHRDFKVKIGAGDPAADIARLGRIAAGIEGRGRLAVVDANQAWDYPTADHWIPALHEMGVGLFEQPLPDWDVAGLARLGARHPLPILADESVFTPHDMHRVAAEAAAGAVSLKLVKHGGLFSMLDVAAVASAAGIGLYGGCLLEGPVGTAAHLHAFASLPSLAWGTESFGPLILSDTLSTEPLEYRDFGVAIPQGPGLGVALDEDKVAQYRRAGGSAHA
ncbi:MAG: muconate/chloromuconate family cycloisomerase [Pseudomonadota bacterium]